MKILGTIKDVEKHTLLNYMSIYKVAMIILINQVTRVGSFFRGAVSSMEKSGFFRPGRNMFLPFLPMLLEETYLFQFSLNFSFR